MLGWLIGAAVVLLVLLLVCLWALKQARDFNRNMDLVRHITEGYPPIPDPLPEPTPYPAPTITTRKEDHQC